MKTHSLAPFTNEYEALSIGELKIENREDRVSIYGSIDITKDEDGLQKAMILKNLLEEITNVLKSEKLPDKLPQVQAAGQVKNPFSEGE